MAAVKSCIGSRLSVFGKSTCAKQETVRRQFSHRLVCEHSRVAVNLRLPKEIIEFESNSTGYRVTTGICSRTIKVAQRGTDISKRCSESAWQI